MVHVWFVVEVVGGKEGGRESLIVDWLDIWCSPGVIFFRTTCLDVTSWVVLYKWRCCCFLA